MTSRMPPPPTAFGLAPKDVQIMGGGEDKEDGIREDDKDGSYTDTPSIAPRHVERKKDVSSVISAKHFEK